MINSLAALALGSLAALSTPALADEVWFDDFDEAAAFTKEQGKDLLVDFTGSDFQIQAVENRVAGNAGCEVFNFQHVCVLNSFIRRRLRG